MQCKSRSPALAEGHLRLWGAGHTAGSRYRRVPSAKTEEAQDSLLGAAGAGDTSSPGPGPAAPARRPGLWPRISAAPSSAKRPPRPRAAAEAERQRASPGSRRRPASVTPTHTPSHTTARTSSQPLAPSRPFSLTPRLRLSHAQPAGSLGGGEPRPRGRGADARPPRRRSPACPGDAPAPGVGRKTTRTPPEVPPLNA